MIRILCPEIVLRKLEFRSMISSVVEPAGAGLFSRNRSREPEPGAGAGQDWTGSTTLMISLVSHQ